MKLTLQPKVLRWARTRAGYQEQELADDIDVAPAKVEKWEVTGEIQYAQVEKLAAKTHTPIGLLFLADPPVEKLPINDFRTVGDEPIRAPSPELLDTVYTMLARRSWMRENLIGLDAPKLPFIGSARHGMKPEVVARNMREVLNMANNWAEEYPSWVAAQVALREKIEDAGIMIFINGVVGNNVHRPLKTDEFRGFALCDEYAPLIFINNADAKSAQMFTIAHELAHLWIGEDGISNLPNLQVTNSDTERFCNAVAAEFLVPSADLKNVWAKAVGQNHPFDFLAAAFRVSPIVAARRAQDLGYINRQEFFSFLDHYKAQRPKKASGGDFWKTTNVRIDPRFGASVVRAAKEGRLLYSDAYRLTGLKAETFATYSKGFGY